MIPYNTLIVLVGVSVLGACAGLVGCFATLRRRALTGDALAHAALPGLCLAFLITGVRSMPVLLVGALISGLVGVGIISFLRRWTRIKEDASIGIVLSVFFGAGIVLVRVIQNQPTTGNRAGIESYIFGKPAAMIAQDVYLILSAALFSLFLVVLLYKEFKLVAFDPDFAHVEGWPALLLDLVLMGLLAVVVVIGLPAVGVVLMAALLIVPSVAARFWSDRLGVILVLSSVFGLLTGSIGAWLSSRSEHLPAGAIIVLVGTVLFLVSAILAPRRGVLGRWLAHVSFQKALERRKLLRVLYDLTEPSLPRRAPLSWEALRQQRSWSEHRLRWLLRWGVRRNLLSATPQTSAKGEPQYMLTERGLHRAAEVARQYRLWQTFLSEYPDRASVNVSLSLAPIEDLLPQPLVEELVEKLEQTGRMPVDGSELAGEEDLSDAASWVEEVK